VPPLGSSKVFPRSSVKGIVRVAGARGATHLEFRDQDNRRLVVIEQGFAKNDVETLAQFLNAKLSWDMDWKNSSPAEMIAMMKPDEHAEIMKRMTPDEQAAELALMTPEQRTELEKEMMKKTQAKR
jgi:Mg/Co/Ni transporter MgtE